MLMNFVFFMKMFQEKKTRSTESWSFQKNAILNSEAFLICLRDDENKLIGAGYFSYTLDQGVYAIAAYDRELFQKPLGHAVQYAAIKELKKLDVNGIT